MVLHKHRIVPGHMGGTYAPSNVIKVNIPMHAFLHKCLWETHGKLQDKIAWLMLSGKTEEGEQAAKLLQKQACQTPTFRAKVSAGNTGLKKPWVALRNKNNPKPASGTSRSAVWRHKKQEHSVSGAL